ncbi:hypothetical protein B0T44_09825 [Nocardia donostiensis]|uniref:Uncharacterized protein n=1 Tax=Nocardia donostiensis TaxID=1538463 RepID=A0A1V2TG27_9NOCA|nr:hypothetical protein B0T46_13155 [Nocardia donostiensis]OQS14686.1 hypothetical protein B0T36_13185 [Nocardia donostiensis]OQS20632.1 hypothetical protein B0T44_09825 [Nocardia donostiensis]
MDQVSALRRWTDCGALWRVVARRPGSVTIGLYTCTGGEEVDRIVSDDPAVLAYIGNRESSDD